MFIVTEGVEGAGKTTQIRGLADRLRAQGHDVVLTREPGGSPLAEEVRSLVVNGEPNRMDAHTELLLFTAARRDHVERIIKPALARGAIVLCDRFLDSTHALQGAAGVPAELIDTLHAACVGIEPDLVIFFGMEPSVALKRAHARAGTAQIAEDRMERKGEGFHQRVADILRQRAQRHGALLIDANGTIEEVAARVDALLEPILAARRA